MSDKFNSELLPLPDRAFFEKIDLENKRIASIPDKEFIERYTRRRIPKTINEITAEAKISNEELPFFIESNIQQLIEYSRTRDHVDGFDRDVDTLYNLYRNINVRPENELMGEYRTLLATADSFWGKYSAKLPNKVYSNLIGRINNFSNRVIHPSRVLEVPFVEEGTSPLNNIYNYDGEWLRLPGSSNYRQFIERTVVDEVAKIADKGGIPEKSVFHGTASASLVGIAQHSAILSAAEAQRNNLDIRAGEYISVRKWGNLDDESGKTLGLEDVYAASLIQGAYQMTLWFDGYPVVFGISREKFEKYQSSNGKPPGIYENLRGDGLVLGSKVPLHLIDAVYTHSRSLPPLKEWAEKNCDTGTKVISLEAASHYELIKSNLAFLQSAKGIML